MITIDTEWTKKEEETFVSLVKEHGTDYATIAMKTGKRNKQAVKLHCANYAKRLKAGELVDQELYDKLVTEAE